MMSRILYFDCFSGISGDMVLGALVDAGLPIDELRRALGSLALPGCEIEARKVLRAGVSATKFIVHERHDAAASSELQAVSPQHPEPRTQHPEPSPHSRPHHHDEPQAGFGQGGVEREHHQHGHRSLAEICTLIDRSALTAPGRERAKTMFRRLAEAEASIHQMTVDQVHLHEVGAIDSIIDIVGAVFALEWFGADACGASALNVGGGTVMTAHGLLPVPAPATVALLGDAPIYSGPVHHELVTPTGALIVTTYATSFGGLPPMRVERVGYGAGHRDVPGHPNVLRVLIGQRPESVETDRVTVIECEIDDMNPQIYGVAMDQLYAAGALDVFYVAAQMKKNRPGTLLTVVAPPHLRAELSDIVFRETTTIGLRYYEVDRECLPREVVTLETPVGGIRFKIARRNGRVINAAPEFEDVARAAAAHGLSAKEVYALAIKTYRGES